MANIIACRIGNHNRAMPDWPTPDLSGLFDALARWPLDTRVNFSNEPGYAGRPGTAPFRGRAWGHCVGRYDQSLGRVIYHGTQPIHPDHPEAVRYCGNFIGYSFGFWLDTDDLVLIERLDNAIAENLSAHPPRSRRMGPQFAGGGHHVSG